MYFVADTSGVLLFSKRQVIAKRSINSGINRGVPTAIGRFFGVGINKDGASINSGINRGVPTAIGRFFGVGINKV